jgi:cell division protein FtsB
MPTNKDQNEHKIRQILFNEVSAVIALIGFCFGIYNYITTPVERLQNKIEEHTTAIQLLKQTDVNTAELMLVLQKQIDEVKTQQRADSGKLNEVDKKIERILTILESQSS